MTIEQLRTLIEHHQDRGSLPVELVLAICMKESSFRSYAIKYEPQYRYLVGDQAKMAVAELLGQKHSWGLMQVMGAVAREYGFTGAFHELWDPQIGLRYGMNHLNKLYRRHGNWPDTIASYNAGIPSKVNGAYKNQAYVNFVLARWSEYEQQIPLKSTEV